MKTLKQLREDRNQALSEANMVSDIPVILVLKRRSIRRYPDGQIVGMYYNDRLNRYIAIPYEQATLTDAG